MIMYCLEKKGVVIILTGARKIKIKKEKINDKRN